MKRTLLEKTDYLGQASKIISNSGLFSEETSDRIIDSLKNVDIHAFNHAPNWLSKYLKGIARMLVQYCGGDNNKAKGFLTECPAVFDYYIDKVVLPNRQKMDEKQQKEFDDNFVNKMSYEDVKNKIEEIQNELDAKSKEELANMDLDKSTSNYSLVPISSFEEFNSKYGGRATGDGSSDLFAGGGGTAWCHANSMPVYDNWVGDKNKNGKFFVLQNNNWKDIPFNAETNKEMQGKDDYGNSLIALFVDRFGRLKRATLRCNHIGTEGSADNQYNTYAELSKIAGFNVEEEVSKYCEKFSVDKTLVLLNNNTECWGPDLELISKEELTEIVIPEGVTMIANEAFTDCRQLKTVVLPKSLKSIGEYAFASCFNLEDIVFPEGLEVIDERAFSSCSSLKSIVLPSSIKTLGIQCFLWCRELKSVDLSQVTNIEDNELPSGLFSSCVQLTDVKLPNNLVDLGTFTFYCCENLEKIDLPSSLLYLGASSFEGCTKLQSIVLPKDITYIPTSIFRHCVSLKNINLDNVFYFSSGSFAYCDSLDDVRLERVTKIDNKAFYACKNLKKVIITSIASERLLDFDKSAFAECYSLTIYTTNDVVEKYCKENGIECVKMEDTRKAYEPSLSDEDMIDNLDLDDFDIDDFNMDENLQDNNINEKLNDPKIEEINNFIEDIYDLRQQGLQQEGEYSLGNLLFKEFRNMGYLDNLKDLKNELTGKDLSLK